MGTLREEDISALAAILGEPESAPPDVAPRPRRSLRQRRLVVAGLVVVLVGLATTAFTALIGSLNHQSAGPTTTHTVKRGDLLVTVTEEGSLESTESLDIKCTVAGGTTIVWVIEDGKEVAEGTEILRLDSSKLEEDINRQNIAWEKARASDIQAAKDFSAAEIAVKEYVEGTFKKDLRKAESEVAVALGALHSAENSLQHGERMFRKGYITPLQLEAMKAAVERAKLDLGTAEIGKDVLERFTRPKMLQELEGKRDAADAKRASEKASLVFEESKLKRLTTQLEQCAVRAPRAGLVIYSDDRARWDPDAAVKVGMKAHEGQTILRLPDLSTMRVKAIVHESKVDQLRPGMRARIRILDREFQGAVVAIANRPEQDWMNAASKRFAVKVNIDGTPKDLRPGMTSEVEILVTHLENVISLPVAAVAEKRGQSYCCVKKDKALERRNVVLGQGNDQFIEIKEGITVGEEVVLNPRAALGETSEESPKQPESDVKKKFGTGAAKPQANQKQPKDAEKNSPGDSQAQAPQDTGEKAADKSVGRAAEKSEGKADGQGKGKADGKGDEKTGAKNDVKSANK